MTGTFLIRPTKDATDDSGNVVVVTKNLESLLQNNNNASAEVAGRSEMHWFNDNLVNDITLVDGLFALLTGEFYEKDGAYRKIGRQFNMSPSDLLQHAPLIQFIARWKPWKKGIQMAKKGFETPELQRIYSDWNELWNIVYPPTDESTLRATTN